MLSPESRAELIGRASGLRQEISDLNAERDAARQTNAESVNDAKLIAEVVALESQRNAAKSERDLSVASSEDAILLMENAINAQVAATTHANAGESVPVAPESVAVPGDAIPTEAELTEAAETAAKEPAPETDPASVTESASATKNTKGGNR